MLDYEYTEHMIFNNLGTWLLMPAMIPDERLRAAGFNLRKVIRYHGFKEEVYLEDFVPAKQFRQQLGVDEDKTLVIVRPPSTTGNYHDERSESLFRKCIEHCLADPNAHVLIVNRTKQETDLFSSTLKKKNVRVLEGTVDGLQLLWHSDVVVSGGGTMNREAALLGVPTYSIFTGKRPYLDELLQEQGKLRFVESTSDVETIPVVKRTILGHYSATNKGIVKSVVQQLIDLKGRSAHTRGFSRG
jgi:predicted glycosyltransferase